MARRITEEYVTKSLLKWLQDSGWTIICFDFPQSGTGKVLHPSTTTSKTEDAVIPDIIAIKGSIVVHFENKDRFVLDDFDKVLYLRTTHDYDGAYANLLDGYTYDCIFYGIGMPYSASNYSKALGELNKVDFVVFLMEDDEILIIGDHRDIFF